MTDTLPLSIQPVISYPKEAEVGKTYLMEIDLQMPESGFEWQYEEEEYLIYCMVNAGNLFTVTSVGEPAIVLHRFGGTYGNARFLLEVGQQEREGDIKITLVNSWGVPVKIINLDKIIILKEVVNKHQLNRQEILTSTTVSDFLPAGNIWQKTTANNIDQSISKTAISQSLKVSQPIPSNVRQGAANFVGREEELAAIHAKLQEGQGVIVCTVEGMGGVGKTELALQYATRYQQEYVARYWLSLREMGLAQAVVTIASPYLDIPEAMQSASLDEQAAWYWQNWLPESGKLLVILDDVPNAESIPDLAMPIDPRVRVLVTTRERELNVGFESVPLDVLSDEQVLELLRKIVGAAKIDKELPIVREICKTLGYLPLGIELIGEYLSKNRFLTFAKLQAKLNLADESISRERKHKFYGDRGMEAAIQLSWDDISNSSQRVAMLLGLFAPVEILWELVVETGVSAEITETELNEARGQLDRLSFIQPIDEGCDFYKIHPLIRQFFRAKLLKAEENHQFRQAFVTSLLAVAKKIPQSPTLDLIARVSPAIPHLDMLSREMLGDVLNLEEDLYWVFTGTARFYAGQGFYALAEDPYKRCCQAIKAFLGERHPSVATSINNLAELYRLQGRYEEAEPLYIQALSLRQELLGERHPSVATSINNLAELYRLQGRYEEAEPLYIQALSLYQELLGERHSSVATSINNLAELYRLQGRYEEAEPLYIQALSLRQELLGERHPSVATSIKNLADLYRSQGRYEEAEPLYIQALSLMQELLGESHPSVAFSINNLADLYRSQGRYEEAEPLYKQSLSLYQKLLGDRHPSVAMSINNLAGLYSSQGRYEEAEPLLKQALSLRQELLGERHPDVASSINNLALLYSSQERYEEAEPLLKQALSLSQELLGERHPDVANSINNLAFLYKSQRRYEEAEPLYVKALEILEVSLGKEHPNAKTVRKDLQYLRLRDLQISAETLVALAAQKFVESSAEDLAKKFTTEAITKITELWKNIKGNLQRKSAKLDEALKKLESGDRSAIDTVIKYLDVLLDDEPEFANELNLLVQTIQAGKIQDNSTMIQNISDNARGWQTNVEGGTAYIGEIHIFPNKST